MRFLVDACVDVRVAEWLRSKGVGVGGHYCYRRFAVSDPSTADRSR